jgi:hypothetical protein
VKRILLDHCVPRPLRRHLPGFHIRTCHEEGWAMLRNGELLAAAEAAGFEVFITADQNLQYQQNLTARRIAVVELPTNWLPLMPALAPAIQQALTVIVPGSYVEIPMP